MKYKINSNIIKKKKITQFNILLISNEKLYVNLKVKIMKGV